YVAIDLENLPQLPAGSKYCQYRGIPAMCGPRGLRGAGDALFHNNGDGTFTDVSRSAGVADEKEYYGLGAVWGDYDNDGDPDLYVANDALPNYLYRNEGNGKFTEIGLSAGVAVDEDGKEQASMGVDFGDYDGASSRRGTISAGPRGFLIPTTTATWTSTWSMGMSILRSIGIP
ncbi:MAG: hypothetical protein DMG10_31205, partial [Acidobacteria bacterium]